MTEVTDPTFYRAPGDAIAAVPESLAYVAAYHPQGAWLADCRRQNKLIWTRPLSVPASHAGIQIRRAESGNAEWSSGAGGRPGRFVERLAAQ